MTEAHKPFGPAHARRQVGPTYRNTYHIFSTKPNNGSIYH
jgi:hypothetical protein